jgi:hypothetical protein
VEWDRRRGVRAVSGGGEGGCGTETCETGMDQYCVTAIGDNRGREEGGDKVRYAVVLERRGEADEGRRGETDEEEKSIRADAANISFM